MNSKLILTSLKIQNFATFTNQHVNFVNGFNSIVGETGSGKSLILDALQMTFGARTDKKLVRLGSAFATIETTFSCDCDDARNFFNELGYPLEDEIIIKRVIYVSGKSKSYLNYQSCPLSVLNQVTRKYVDLVGQFENQKLLSENYQLRLLDNYARTNELFIKYSEEYLKLTKLKAKLIDLNTLKNKQWERKDFLEFQVKELENLNPTVEDETLLKEKKNSIINFETKKKTIAEVSYLLSDGDQSIQSTLQKVEHLLTAIDTDSELTSKISEIITDVTDISYELSKSSNDDYSEENLEEVITLLDKYQILKRKFNTDTEGLLDIYQKYQIEILSMENIENDINSTIIEIDKLATSSHKIAKKLHKIRVESSKSLSSALTSKVHKLNMVGADIILKVDQLEHLSSTGITSLSFIAQTNPGEGYYPIKDIASGGELSRILLAVRQVLSQTGSISVFLFDEIDSGIGGETALTIGKALQNVSSSSQVIAITHLPQIANQSDLLVLVEKESFDDRTMSVVKHINKENIKEYIDVMQTLG